MKFCDSLNPVGYALKGLILPWVGTWELVTPSWSSPAAVVLLAVSPSRFEALRLTMLQRLEQLVEAK